MIAAFSDSKDYLLIRSQDKVFPFSRFQALFHYHRVRLSPYRSKQELGQHVCGMIKVYLPLPVQEPNTFFLRLEQGPVPAQEDFIYVGLPYVMPALFFMNGLKQFPVRNKPVHVRHQPEFIWPVAKHVDQEAAQAVCLDLVIAFTQDKIPRTCNYSFFEFSSFRTVIPFFFISFSASSVVPGATPLHRPFITVTL